MIYIYCRTLALNFAFGRGKTTDGNDTKSTLEEAEETYEGCRADNRPIMLIDEEVGSCVLTKNKVQVH